MSCLNEVLNMVSAIKGIPLEAKRAYDTRFDTIYIHQEDVLKKHFLD